MNSFLFGKTSSQLPILGYRFGDSGPNVLILGGVHGDEVEGVIAAHGLLLRYSKQFDLQLQLTIVPGFNLDGVLAKTRVNARGVDLNRNLPTQDWNPEAFNKRYPPGPSANSEPENQALVSFLKENQPKLIISLHSWKPLLNVNGDCISAAKAIHQLTGYSIEESIGYPTPGCLGTYAGIENQMPTITYEIERGLPAEKILEVHIPAVHEALKVSQGASE